MEGISVMTVDIYQPCPCGSGKKFKFCCHVISDDMDRIVRLIDGNQLRSAVQQLELLAKKNPSNAWVGTTRGMLLMDLGEVDDAAEVLTGVISEHPENELAIVMFAAAMARTEGGEQAKRALHRAFQRCAKKLPSLVSDLAVATSMAHSERGEMIASREHLALALRLASENRRQELFVKLLELDGNSNIPYPLRGSHHLPKLVGSGDAQNEIRKGQKYASVGCWSIAAEIFSSLANAEPDHAEFWHASGLCRLWGGDEKNAAESFHRAARHYADIGTAVECETLAQILDDQTTSDRIERVVFFGEISSVSRLLTLLDSIPRLKRLPDADVRKGSAPPAARYTLIDREWDDNKSATVTIEELPRIVAQIVITDANPDKNEPAMLLLSGIRGASLDDAKSIVTTTTGELLSWTNEDSLPGIFDSVSTESQILQLDWFFPNDFPIIRRRKFSQQFCKSVVNDIWPQQPLRALGGKTPEQAANDPAMRVPLIAAIYLLNSRALRSIHGIDVKDLFARLKIDPLPSFELTDETNLASLSIMQIHRLPTDKLSDDQLITVVNRSMLVRQDEKVYEVLTAAINRPECAAKLDLARAFSCLAEICLNSWRRDEAFTWIDRARKLPVPEGKNPFQIAWNWDLTELKIRLEDATDPGLKTLLDRFVTYYGPKLPQLRSMIEPMLESFNVPSPWDAGSLISPARIPGSEGVWNPAATQSVPASGKLWLPGQ